MRFGIKQICICLVSFRLWQRWLVVFSISIFPVSRNNKTLTFEWTHYSKRLIMWLNFSQWKVKIWGFLKFSYIRYSYSFFLLPSTCFLECRCDIWSSSSQLVPQRWGLHTHQGWWSKNIWNSWVSGDHVRATSTLNYLPLDLCITEASFFKCLLFIANPNLTVTRAWNIGNMV